MQHLTACLLQPTASGSASAQSDAHADAGSILSHTASDADRAYLKLVDAEDEFVVASEDRALCPAAMAVLNRKRSVRSVKNSFRAASRVSDRLLLKTDRVCCIRKLELSVYRLTTAQILYHRMKRQTRDLQPMMKEYCATRPGGHSRRVRSSA